MFSLYELVQNIEYNATGKATVTKIHSFNTSIQKSCLSVF